MTQQPAQPAQSPLTLVMTAKSPQDYTALQELVHHVQSMPPEENPLIIALNRIANVHFARFVFLDNNQLAVITTYDGSFENYINDFINEINGIFNQILEHIVDSSPLPIQNNREEFLDFVRAHDLSCVPPFYAAYPDRTVLDILATPSVPS